MSDCHSNIKNSDSFYSYTQKKIFFSHSFVVEACHVIVIFFLDSVKITIDNNINMIAAYLCSF
jgi:hypothetical protein